jgi:SPP1 family predicted phage head-tail adaptor
MKFIIHACELNKPVTIQETTFVVDDKGNRVQRTGTVAKAWAKVDPLSGREYQRAQSFGASVSHKLTIRYIKGVKPTQTIVLNGRRLRINGIVNPGERNVGLELFCEELV